MHGKSCGASLGTEHYLYASLMDGERVRLSVSAWLHLAPGLHVAEPVGSRCHLGCQVRQVARPTFIDPIEFPV